jgi:hypothetical protein
MMAFVIPFRSKASSDHWKFHSALVNRTIKSILNQVNKDFKVIVVYSDYPENKVDSEFVIWLHFPFPFLKVQDITDYESHGKQYLKTDRDIEFSMDQGRKSIFGSSFAKDLGCNYIMSVDADDLVSDKISQFVADNAAANCPGWYVEKGFVYDENKDRLYRYPKKFYDFCGSSYIVRTDLISIPDFESKNLLDYSFFSGHSWLIILLRDYKNAILQPLPFYGAVYILNPVSWGNSGKIFLKTGLKKWAKILIYGQFIHSKLRKQFTLHKIADNQKSLKTV